MSPALAPLLAEAAAAPPAELVRVDAAPDAVAAIVGACLDAAVDAERRAVAVADVLSGRADLWVCPAHGFVLTSIATLAEGHRELFVRAVQGINLYNRSGMALIDQLAAVSGCRGVRCFIRRPAVGRLVGRLGYVQCGRDGDILEFRKDL